MQLDPSHLGDITSRKILGRVWQTMIQDGAKIEYIAVVACNHFMYAVKAPLHLPDIEELHIGT